MKYLTVGEKLLKYRKIDPLTNCWLWTRSRELVGYGMLRINGKTCKVHRIAYELYIGPLKNQCLHKPICPNRHCFNPEHLYDGTQYQNVQDALNMGTHSNGTGVTGRTHCPKGHEYDYIDPTYFKRRCKTCRKEYYENKKLKKKEIIK